MNKEREEIKNGLESLVPTNSIEAVCDIIVSHPCHIVISKPRKTKLGDFRANHFQGRHQISVNKDLNPYSFLITLVHEYAHLTTFENWGRKVKPHGLEWKSEFRNLLLPFFSLNIFPKDVESALANYLKNPKASSGSDLNLHRALMKHNQSCDELHLEGLQFGEIFVFRNKTYTKGERLRKRYKCQEMASRKHYLFNPLTPVEKIENQSV